MPDMTVLAPLRDAVDAEHEAWGTVARGAEVLRRGVVTGLLRPGARLPEERLAAELGISRNSLRAAFDARATDARVETREVYELVKGLRGFEEVRLKDYDYVLEEAGFARQKDLDFDEFVEVSGASASWRGVATLTMAVLGLCGA